MAQSSTTVPRRRVLKAIAATGAIGSLAGCTGDSGGQQTTETAQTTQGDGGDSGGQQTTETAQTTQGDGGDSGGQQTTETAQTTQGDSGGGLGERVPPLVIEYLSDYGPWEDVIPIVRDDITNGLNHPVELKPMALSAFLENCYNDQRTYHYDTWGSSTTPPNIDPGKFMRNQAIDWAGPNGKSNLSNYVSCEYSDLIFDQQTVGNPEERRNMLQEAMSVYSNDVANVPIVTNNEFSAARKDMLDINGREDMGIALWNTQFFANTTAKNADEYVYSTQNDFLQSMNHLIQTAPLDLAVGGQLLNSTLLAYNNKWELTSQLAESFERNDDSSEFTFNLRGGTFHNGDQITSEHVKFTMNMLEEKDVTFANTQNYTAIETPDDQTVVFKFDQPNPQFLSVHIPLWGILHKPTWEGIETVSEFNPDPYVGSGPFTKASFTQGQSLKISPYDGHPVYSPSSSVIFQKYTDKAAKLQAFRQGEIQVAVNLVGKDLLNLENQMQSDQLQKDTVEGIGVWMLAPSYPRAPVRFSPFSTAVGQAIGRQEVNQVVFADLAEPVLHSNLWSQNHPYWPDNPDEILTKFVDEPTPNPEAAKQTLRDAGWGWDDNGNLRYPEGTDTTPLYPKGEFPSPPEFPCMTQDGEFQNPDG